MIPMVISAILVLVAPFFGRFQQQLYVKLFAILLQFLCFQYLVEKTPQIGFGDAVPNLCKLPPTTEARNNRDNNCAVVSDKFYEFTLATTVVSLLMTLVVAAAARVDRKLPPAHRFTLLAAVLNANLCCVEEETGDKEQHPTTGYHRDWLQLHSAVNNLLSMLIGIAYTIGVIIIAV